MVRAKFKVMRVEMYQGSRFNPESNAYEPQAAYNIHLVPVMDNKTPENKEFYQSTPTGSMVLGGVNEAVAKQFSLDQEFYIDIQAA